MERFAKIFIIIFLSTVFVAIVANSYYKFSAYSAARDRTANFMATMNQEANMVRIYEDRTKTFEMVNGRSTVILPTSDNNTLTCQGSKCCLEIRRVLGDQDISTFDSVKNAQTNGRNVSFFITKTGYAVVFGHRDAGQ
jgi:hypothetical protein